MGFAPGPGAGGSSSIAGSSDVSLSSPQNDHVLSYATGPAKWVNKNISSPTNTVVATSGTTRPTADPAVTVIFKGSNPGNNALDGDIWLGAV